MDDLGRRATAPKSPRPTTSEPDWKEMPAIPDDVFATGEGSLMQALNVKRRKMRTIERRERRSAEKEDARWAQEKKADNRKMAQEKKAAQEKMGLEEEVKGGYGQKLVRWVCEWKHKDESLCSSKKSYESKNEAEKCWCRHKWGTKWHIPRENISARKAQAVVKKVEIDF